MNSVETIVNKSGINNVVISVSDHKIKITHSKIMEKMLAHCQNSLRYYKINLRYLILNHTIHIRFALLGKISLG